MLVAMKIGNSPIWYVLGGALLGYMFHWFYVYFLMKKDQILKLLPDPNDAWLCEWAMEHKEDYKHLIVMSETDFINVPDMWEMYQRDLDENPYCKDCEKESCIDCNVNNYGRPWVGDPDD